MSGTTLYWHDYETWGAVPARDKPSQFAGVRTDLDLNIVGDPLVEYCQPSLDCVPNPFACLVTGITPQKALHEGLPEYQFAAAIFRELSQSGTCGVGYNTLRFDDEVSRYMFYRNFYDPYAREWQNGNSRWDIIDMVRLTYALRPEGIEWPEHEPGVPSFKLEHLTAANGIAHASAHDALSDVQATIAMAKLVKQKQPALYDYLFKHRLKHEAAKLIDIEGCQPLVHVSSMFSSRQGCLTLVLPLAYHPTNKNAVIVYDLTVDPAPLLTLSAEQVAERIFTRTDDLPEGVERIPLKLVHLNKCPVLATPKLLTEQAAERLGISLADCRQHYRQLKPAQLMAKVQAVFGSQNFPPAQDAEMALYEGFISPADRNIAEQVRQASAEQLTDGRFVFADARLTTLLLRYKARNFPQILSATEREQWLNHCEKQLHEPVNGGLSLEDFHGELMALEEQVSEPQQLGVLAALSEWGDYLLESL